MKPPAWSFSALEAFTTCPYQYEAKSVSKRVKEEFSSPHLEWGKEVHSLFEERQRFGVVLPDKLEKHEPYMEELAALPGVRFFERKLAFTRKLEPCGYFSKDVWVRGVTDFSAIDESYARVVDYKTGKKRDKPKQLALFALFTFWERPQVQTVDTEFYWVDLPDGENRVSRRTYKRSNIDALWAMFTPDLRQFVEAYRSETWQPRPSGLCHGWCPVTDCQFWKPKKDR